MWCNAPLNAYTPILFEDSHLILPSSLLLCPPNTAGRYGGLLTLWLSTIYNFKKLEIFTCHLPIKMALANFTCQVCILWLQVIDGEVKIAVSPFLSTAGNDYSPIKGYFGQAVRAPYGQNSSQVPCGCSLGWITYRHI